MSAPILTANTTGNPWVEVFFNPATLDPAAATITIWRTSDGREWKVPGGVRVAVGVAALDFEAPFQVTSTYRAEMFDVTGGSLGWTAQASIVLDVDGTWLHNPLEPTQGVQVEVDADSLADLLRPTPGDNVHTQGSTTPRRIGQRRRALEGVDMVLNVDGAATLAAVDGMLGDYDDTQVPVLCIRTTEHVLWPRTFFFASDGLAWRDRNYHFGGDWAQLVGAVDEVQRPFPGLVLPLLTYDDLDAAYATYTARDAAYPTYTDQDRDYSLAGLAG